jgi:hypothetical protein
LLFPPAFAELFTIMSVDRTIGKRTVFDAGYAQLTDKKDSDDKFNAIETLSYQETNAIAAALGNPGQLDGKASESFIRLYDVAAKQMPGSTAFTAFDTALKAYGKEAADPEKRKGLVKATYDLIVAMQKSNEGTQNVSDKAAIANACFRCASALTKLPVEFRGDGTQLGALKALETKTHTNAATAKLAKRNILAAPMTLDKAMEMAKKNPVPPMKVIFSSKGADGELLFREHQWDAAQSKFVPVDGGNQPEKSKKFAENYRPTQPATVVPTTPEDLEKAALGRLKEASWAADKQELFEYVNKNAIIAAAKETYDNDEESSSIDAAAKKLLAESDEQKVKQKAFLETLQKKVNESIGTKP